MKLLRLPKSDQIEEVNQFTLDYLNQLIKENYDVENWIRFEISIDRKVGHSTQIIRSKEMTLFLENGVLKFGYEEISLSRLIYRLLKRTKLERVKINILKEGTITIKEE